MNSERRPPSPSRTLSAWPARFLRGLWLHGAPTLIAVGFALPLVWMVSASLRQPGLPPPRTIEWVPDPVAWGNYVRLFQVLPLDRYVLNSLAVALVAVPLTLVTASWAGLAMAQLGTRSRYGLSLFSIGLLMVPVAALWLPRFVLFEALGMINSYAALAAPALMGSSPLFVLLFYWTFRRLPAELFQLARLEGANAFDVWLHVALPLARATFGVVAVLAFILYWSDFLAPLLYLRSQDLYTLPVGLQQLQQLDRANWPLLMAAAMMMTAPTVLLFIVVQHYFLQESRLSWIFGS